MKKLKRFQTKYKIDRRTGINVLGRAKSPVIKRTNRPGLKPGSTPMASHFGKCLMQKQMCKLIFCVFRDQQFKNIVKKARQSNNVAEELVRLLEFRLINIVYRALFAATPWAAKQLVSHKKVKLNGKIVNVGNHEIKVGDVIELVDKCADNPHVKAAAQTKERIVPDFMKVEGLKCTIIGNPTQNAPYMKNLNFTMAIEAK